MQLQIGVDRNLKEDLNLVGQDELLRRISCTCLHELFEEQADIQGEATALVCAAATISYAELESQANRLAHYLRELGAGKGSLIGLFLERSHLPIIAILACLKAGAAYVPLDPGFPDDRVTYIAYEAEIALVL